MKTKFISLFMLAMLCLMLGTAQPAQAATQDKCNKDYANSSSFLGFPTWYKYLQVEFIPKGSDVAPDNPSINGPATVDTCNVKADFTNPATYAAILLVIFEILMRVAGLAAVVFVIVGGFLFITSDGQPDKAKKARWTIFNALIGLGIAMVAVAAVNLIGNTLR